MPRSPAPKPPHSANNDYLGGLPALSVLRSLPDSHSIAFSVMTFTTTSVPPTERPVPYWKNCLVFVTLSNTIASTTGSLPEEPLAPTSEIAIIWYLSCTWPFQTTTVNDVRTGPGSSPAMPRADVPLLTDMQSVGGPAPTHNVNRYCPLRQEVEEPAGRQFSICVYLC